MMRYMKKFLDLAALLIVIAGSACMPWDENDLDSEEYPMHVGAVHIYRLEGFTQGDSMVITTVGTRRHDDHTIYVDSVAYFTDDTLNYSTETYYAITSSYLYYYGDEAIGLLDDPERIIDFPLYEGKLWYYEPGDTTGPYRECVGIDTLWLEPGRYRAFCVEPSTSATGGKIVRYWYAPDVGLVKHGESDLTGNSKNMEILGYYPTGIPVDTTEEKSR